jgi:signal transduction histidine kinase/DNA-binding response OmpR family regulator
MDDSILNKIQIGILGFDDKLNCLYSNKYMKEYINSNLNVGKITDCNIYYHLDEEENKELDAKFFGMCEESESTCRIINKNERGYKWFKLKRTLNVTTYIFTYEDVDDIKQLEIELRECKEKSEKIYSHKALFLANMSHEIRTPLNGIIGMLTLLEDTFLNNEQKNYIEMLRECSISLMTIINDILDYSKLEAGKITLNIECGDILNCIESTNDILLSKIYEKKLDYNYSINPNVPHFIKGDMNRIKQIMLNLLTNSIKFTEKGQITFDVSAKNKENSDEVIVKFSISDTGCGINSIDRDKLFKSFSQIGSPTINKIYQGTGLGLAISKELVVLMGGEIWVDWSEPDKGSRFCFTIKTSKCDCGGNNIDDDKHILKDKKVFVLDDKLENRLGIAALTQRWGMKVTAYSSSAEALYFIKTNHYELGLVDICMPDISGIDFANKLKLQLISTNKEPIPLIALSSLGENLSEHNGSFRSHLIKPVKETKLKKVCSEILTSSKYKFKKEDRPTIHFNDYLSSNNLNNSIKENIRIMLVEDVPINQRVVVSFLHKMGFDNIDVYDNGKQCLEVLVTKQYDILLLDIRMPILNGENVIKYILDYYRNEKNSKTAKYKLANTRKPYIIAVTAYCLKEDRDKYLQMGFDDYIPKPISINELNICMNTCIENLLEN